MSAYKLYEITQLISSFRSDCHSKIKKIISKERTPKLQSKIPV